MTATRVLVVEDSRTYAAALVRTLEHGAEVTVVGVCPSAEEALESLARLRPDVVTMDLELPGIGGLEAVEQIMRWSPLPILVLSSHVGPGSEKTAAALAAGALDALPKSSLELKDPEGEAAARLRRRIRVLSGARVIRHPGRRGPRSNRPYGADGHRATDGRAALVIGVCASTGGPQAISQLIAELPASFEIPILVVQHIVHGFGAGLARWLDSAAELPVRIAEHGASLERGVSVAPDDAHLRLDRGFRLSLDRESEAGYHRPSADVLLESLAASAGDGAVAVVLTGMGRDGAEGAQAVRGAGGLTIAQDEATSAVYGMPRAAAELGVNLVLPLVEIPAALTGIRHELRLPSTLR